MGIDWEAKVAGPTVKVFGDSALYVPRDNSTPYVITGVFDEAYQDITILDGQDAITTDAKPVIGINDSQCIGPLWDQDDRVVIGIVVNADGSYSIPGTARTYIVKEAQADGHGHTMLTLNKTAAYSP